MLIQCAACGRPVYSPYRFGKAECGYCYAQTAVNTGKQVTPETLDWQEPMRRLAAQSSDRKKKEELLCLLGDEKTLLEVRRRREEAERRWKEILADAENAWTTSEDPNQIREIIAMLDDLPDSTVVQDWIDKLNQKIKDIQDQKEVARLTEWITDSWNESRADSIEEQLKALSCVPGAKQALQMLQDRKEQAQIRREEERKAAIRAKRKKLRIKLLIAAAVIALITANGLYSCYVVQPGRLETARTQAKEKDYAQAEDTYRSLTAVTLFDNREVQRAAETELKEVRNAYGEQLLAQEEWEKAIEFFKAAGNNQREWEAYRLYGDFLAASGQWEKAIAQWRKVPASDDRLKQLYTSWILASIDQADYGNAISIYDNADQEELTSRGITVEWLYLQQGLRYMEEKKTALAIEALGRAGDGEEVLALLQTLRIRQVEEDNEIQSLLYMWKEKPTLQDAMLESLKKAGEKYTLIDQQLRYWKMLADAGIDVTKVYSAGTGVKVRGLQIPELQDDSDGTNNVRKPLVFVRQEKEYELGLLTLFPTVTSHDMSDESSYTLTLMPELWQMLPEDRRAESLDDCTFILLVDLTYRRDGDVNATSIMKDYIHESLYKTTSGNKNYQEKTITTKITVPCFTAMHRIWAWNYPDDSAALLATREEPSEKRPDFSILLGSSLTIDWRTMKYSTPLKELGLAGKFQQQWVSKGLSLFYELVGGEAK